MNHEPLRPHDVRHERVLEALMTGQVQADDPAAVELRHCTECSERLRRLQCVTSLLDAAGSERRSILDEAIERRDPIPAQRPAGTARRRWPILVSAAAVIIAATVYLPLRGCGGTGPNDGMLLGPGAREGEYWPSGAVKEFTDFRWPGQQLLLDEAYVIQVFEQDAGGALAVEPIAKSEPMQTRKWTPAPAELARVNACVRIQWRVVVMNQATGATNPGRFVPSHRQ